MLKAVIDTNVIVSALLNENGPPAKILEKIYNKDIIVPVDERIIEEYVRVLNYSKFGFDKLDVELFLFFIRHNGKPADKCRALEGIMLPADDVKFMEVAVKTEADFLITGNSKHFNFAEYRGCRIISPAEFLRAHG